MTVPRSVFGKAGPPVHELVYRRLRDRVLFGDLAPGQAVTIQGLVQDLGVGMTPVREALRRLTSEGALVFQGNRRICVPNLTVGDLEQLLQIRLALEPDLAARACDRCAPGDIDALEDIDTRLDAVIAAGDLPGYLRLNHEFHTTLYALARAEILSGLVGGLWLRFGPSLRIVLQGLEPQSPDMHKAVLQALRAGDRGATAQALRQDVLQGMERVRRRLDSGAD